MQLADDHPNRRQFDQVLGMSPAAFVGICWGAYAAVVDGKTFILPTYLQSLEPLYGSAVQAFLDRFSRDLAQLRDELRTTFEQRLRVARLAGNVGSVRSSIEVTEFPWLQRYPLLRHQSGRYAVWHPLIFARGMEHAVHQSLSSLGQQYTDPFSKVFETYVMQLLREASIDYVDEASFKSKHLPNSPAVEAIVELPGGNVLIEAKMSLFPDEVVLSDSSDVVFRKLRRLRDAIVQGWRVTEILAGEQPRQRSGGTEARRNYLIVVTSRQLNVCNGEQLRRLFGENVLDDIAPESRFGSPSDEQLAWLPPKNMFFLSIEEFEHLAGCLGQGEVDLWPLLSNAAEAQATPASSVFQFDQLLGEHTKKWTMPKIQVAARDQVEAELMRFFATK